MKKRQIKKLLKLEALLQAELSDTYTSCMLDMFPMRDNRQMPIPSKRKMIYHVEKQFIAQNPSLKNSKSISSIIAKYVSKRYEVLK